jgi:hypothetical protein
MLHASQPPAPLRTANPSVTASPELEAVIFKALEKDRGRRFATAREFAKALETLLPSLNDTPGAPPPLPVMSELTEDPTRASGPAVDSRAPTLRDVTGAATVQTVATGAPRDFAQATLERVEVDKHAAAPGAKRRMGGVIAAALVVIAGITAAVWWRNQPEPAQPAQTVSSPAPPANATVTVEKPRVAVASAIPIAQGHLGINAFPWANVTSIRNLDNGSSVELHGALVTPAPIDLAPGRYEITLSNPAFRNTLTEQVEVRANEDAVVNARFADPAAAALPRFEGQP